jgi:O-antigen ligase
MTLAFAYRAARTTLLVGEILVFGWLFATESLTALGWLTLVIGVALGTVLLVFTDWPIGCVVMLTIAATTPQFKLTVFDLHLRPEHVATAVAILAILVQALAGQPLKPRLRSFDYWVAAYVAANFFSSALTSPQPAMTLRWASLNALVVTPYFLARVLVRNDRHVWLALRALLCVGAGEALYGTLASVSNHILGTTWGVELGQYGAIPGTYGTQFEANLFGSYTGCAAVMFLAFFLLSKEPRRFWYGLGLTVCLVAVFFSLARAALLGLPIPVLVLFWISFKKGQFQLRRLLPVGIGIGLVLLLLSPLLIEYVTTRFSTIDLSSASTDVTVAGRMIQMAAAVDDVKVHPIFGTGTSSFQLLFKLADLGIYVNYEDNDIGWISNSPLRILHDTGIVGLAFFLAFLGTLARTTYRALRTATFSTKLSIAALLAGLLLYAITFQVTEATLLSFTWWHLGLLAAAASVATDRGRLTASAPQ